MIYYYAGYAQSRWPERLSLELKPSLAMNADAFFAPFRALGQQYLAMQRISAMEQQQPQKPSTIAIGHRQREVDQMDQEVSEVTQCSYRSRIKPETPLKGFSDKVLNFLHAEKPDDLSIGSPLDTFPPSEGPSDTISWESSLRTEATSIAKAMKSDDSIASPGPFGPAPILEQEFTSDSSYVWSRRRDVAYSFDTLTSSSATDDNRASRPVNKQFGAAQ